MFAMIFLVFVFIKYKDQKLNFLEKMTFDPITFFRKTLHVHSKRERMEIIDLHLKFVERSC